MLKTNSNCSECPNESCLIKKSLYADNNKLINAYKSVIHCKKGQQFIMEGTPVNGLYFVNSGKAKVLKTGIFGKEQILRFAKKGEVIGHRGFGTSDKYPISAVALEDSMLCSFSSEAMENLLLKVPRLTYELMRFYAEELNNSESKVKAMAQMTVREKVIDTLLYLHRKFGTNHKGHTNIKLSRKEIGEYSGTTQEQVTRIISALKKEEIIECQGKNIKLLDVHQLQNEIQEHNFFLDH